MVVRSPWDLLVPIAASAIRRDGRSVVRILFLRVVSGDVFFAARPVRLVYSFRFAVGWEFFCSGSAMTDRVYQLEKLGWCLDPTFLWWFASPSGCLLLRRVGVDAACGVGPLLHRRRDGLRPSSSACTFIDFTACWIPQRATLGAISKL